MRVNVCMHVLMNDRAVRPEVCLVSLKSVECDELNFDINHSIYTPQECSELNNRSRSIIADRIADRISQVKTYSDRIVLEHVVFSFDK